MGNRIIDTLKRFNIKYTRYGDRDSDAIEFRINDVRISLSAFDNNLNICCYVEEDYTTKMVLSFGYTTYEDIVKNILDQIVNKQGMK